MPDNNEQTISTEITIVDPAYDINYPLYLRRGEDGDTLKYPCAVSLNDNGIVFGSNDLGPTNYYTKLTGTISANCESCNTYFGIENVEYSTFGLDAFNNDLYNSYINSGFIPQVSIYADITYQESHQFMKLCTLDKHSCKPNYYSEPWTWDNNGEYRITLVFKFDENSGDPVAMSLVTNSAVSNFANICSNISNETYVVNAIYIYFHSSKYCKYKMILEK